ncbi:MAG TPA: hypothetical protein VFO27_06320 [Bryobacteraceae bacterium]|nr:hypothetical protein [Bryobacteraceae bacterium]
MVKVADRLPFENTIVLSSTFPTVEAKAKFMVPSSGTGYTSPNCTESVGCWAGGSVSVTPVMVGEIGYIRRSLERALEFSEAHEVPLLEHPELQRALAR